MSIIMGGLLHAASDRSTLYAIIVNLTVIYTDDAAPMDASTCRGRCFSPTEGHLNAPCNFRQGVRGVLFLSGEECSKGSRRSQPLRPPIYHYRGGVPQLLTPYNAARDHCRWKCKLVSGRTVMLVCIAVVMLSCQLLHVIRTLSSGVILITPSARSGIPYTHPSLSAQNPFYQKTEDATAQHVGVRV